MQTTGNTILITGGSTGIGRAIARAFHAQNNRIIVTSRNQARLAQLQQEFPDWSTYPADLTCTADVIELVAFIEEQHGSLNILVNNAGQQTACNFLHQVPSPAALVGEMRLNFEAALLLASLLLPVLLHSPAALIVNVGSALGAVPRSAYPVYSASKAALSALSVCLRRQLRETNVSVMELVPPLTDTLMNAERSGPKMSPESVAEALLCGIQNNRRTIRPGSSSILHAISRVSPGLASRLVEASP
ncbi:MAG: SDR family NAD(P)-dependent oxidoreductase [Leptospiraceae bacterium]|nr:SDR family NAD(P)-dependent oxidoreductase [Leptospiraceae bacterium]